MARTSEKCILLVEDDPNDVFFLRLALEQAGITNPVNVASNGQEAIDYLEGNGQFSNRELFPWPDLVLLDLNLPLVPGIHVLKWIRSRPDFAFLLVLVLTSSQDERDIEECSRLGARSFLLKPISKQERMQLVRSLKDYWLDLNVSAVPEIHPAARMDACAP